MDTAVPFVEHRDATIATVAALPCRTEMVLARVGLTPLPMPMPSDHLREGGHIDVTADLALALQPRTDILATPDDPDDRALYRWVLGHHLAFGVWRMLGDLLENMVLYGVTEESTNEAASWYDRYSALQLYAGSCTASTYANVIRRRMAACHPAFSGIWARDYERILGLLARLELPSGGVLRNALKRHRKLHMTIATILVPQGESLLKETGRRAGHGATDAERDILDTFFLVRRGPVSFGQFRAHMLRRLASAQCDLAAHPLVPESHVAAVALLPGDISSALCDVATTLSARL